MRKRGRTDSNQALIVKALRQCGVSVQVLSGVGEGVPDLLCGWQGRNTLLEVKDGTLPPSKRRLTPEEKDWHDNWRGNVLIVESPEEAIRFVRS